MCQQLLSSKKVCYYFQCYLEAGKSKAGNVREQKAKIVNHFLQHKDPRASKKTRGRSEYVVATGHEPIFVEIAGTYRGKEIRDGAKGNLI